MSAGEIAASLIEFGIVVAVTFGLLCLLTSYFRFQQMADRAESGGEDAPAPATALRMQIARRLGTAPRAPEPFAVLLVRAAGPAAAEDRDMARVSRLVRQGIRERDNLLQLDEGTLGVVVGGGRACGMEVAGRILEQFPGPDAVRIAVGSHPEDGAKVEDLLATAWRGLEPEAGPPIRATAAGSDAAADARPRPTPADPLAAAPAGQRRLLDPVTGLLAEAHLGGVLHKRIAQWRRTGAAGSVLAIEVDHLDRYLDHYGPAGRDDILRHLGCHLQTALREDDLLARCAENRAVVLMTATAAQAGNAAQRIADGIRGLDIAHVDNRLKVTVSIGVAAYLDHGAAPRRLLAHAVTALEVAKAKGRDQCLVYEPGMQATPRAARDAPSF